MALKVKHVDPEILRKHLIDKYSIGIIALNDTDIRIAFSCVEKDDIPHVFESIAKAIDDLIEKKSCSLKYLEQLFFLNLFYVIYVITLNQELEYWIVMYYSLFHFHQYVAILRVYPFGIHHFITSIIQFHF